MLFLLGGLPLLALMDRRWEVEGTDGFSGPTAVTTLCWSWVSHPGLPASWPMLYLKVDVGEGSGKQVVNGYLPQCSLVLARFFVMS